MSGTVLVEDVAEGVRQLTLNRPHRLNAIVAELLDDLLAALGAAESDPAVRAIMLTGAGRAFCSGDDLKEFAAQSSAGTARAFAERLQDVTRALIFGEKPVIGAIRGWAVGGGLEWVVNCDLAIAAEGTRFFFPETSHGMFVTGGASVLLPRMVGLARARALIMLGERFDAAEAQRLGLIWKVVPEAELAAEALTTASRIAALPQGPVRALKHALARIGREEIEACLTLETEAAVAGFLDPETARRVARFR